MNLQQKLARISELEREYGIIRISIQHKDSESVLGTNSVVDYVLEVLEKNLPRLFDDSLYYEPYK